MTLNHSKTMERPFYKPYLLIAVLIAQTVLHLGWLSFSTQVGQTTVPWMLNQGLRFFDTLIEQRAPVTAIILAIFQRLLPLEPILVTRASNLILILMISVLVYTLSYRLSNRNRLAANAAVLVWAWWEPVFGRVMFYFETVLGFVILIALLVWLLSADRKPFWLAPLTAGILLGLGTLVKQHGWAVVAAFLVWLVFFRPRQKYHWQSVLVYLGGAFLLPILTGLIFAMQGTLDTYLFWNYGFNLSGLIQGHFPTGDFVRRYLVTVLFVLPFLLIAWRDQDRRPTSLLLLLLWVSSHATLLLNFSEEHLMAALPLLAVISGITIAWIVATMNIKWHALFTWIKEASTTSLALVGVLATFAIAWVWAGLAAYVPHPLGRARIPAYDEFQLVAEQLNALREPGDTLFVLPELDGNPQLHVMTDMMPPGFWVNNHTPFLRVPGVIERLLAEWSENPPDFMVYFPDLEPDALSMGPLVDFMQANYVEVGRVEDIMFNGEALIYRLKPS